MDQIVTLIGYRGSGKSTVAPILARQLDCKWIDADVEIERRADRTIQQIFESGGESEFRTLERVLMQELLSGPPLIIAAGGGAILNQATRTDMQDAGPVVWLTASDDELAKRISTDPTTGERRPSLTGQNVEDEVAAVMKIRKPIYSQTATLQIATEGQTAEQIADRILAAIPNGQLFNKSTAATDQITGDSASGDRPC
ncbi:UNVERIFIED_CONTAM: hypothetical protein GTU68_061601 [Idotea baltica]|nr:hypothetical protein [Idotea baltica]